MGSIIAIVIVIVAGWVLMGMARKKASGGEIAAQRPGTSSTPGEKLHWLVVASGADAGQAFHIGSRRATIGRGKNNFVQISDPAASRVSCQVVAEGDGLTVIDMSSYNGTLINDEVVKKAVLSEGDRLQVADTVFIYYRSGDHGSNAGLGRKEAGVTTELRTSMVQGRSVRSEAAGMLLIQMGGDKAQAAAVMKVSPEEFEKLLQG